MATADEYAAWIVKNADKKGTPEFQTVATAYEQAKSAGQPKQPAKPTGDASNGGKIDGAVMGFNDLPIGVGQLMQNIPLVDKGLNVVRSGIRGGLNAVGAKETAELFGDVSKEDFNNRVKSRNDQYEADKEAAGREGFDWSRLGGSVVNPMGWIGGGALKRAQGVKQLATAGAKMGAIGAAMQPVANGGDSFWGDKATQVGVGAAGGAVLTPAISKVTQAGAKAVGSLADKAKQYVSPQNIEVTVNNTFANHGVNPADVPDAILQSVRRQVTEAVSTGRRNLELPEMIRRAEFEAVGLTGDAAPTLGQMSRDSLQFANEKNLSGVALSGPNGNQLARRFDLQNQRLQDVFDQVGARDAIDRVGAGQTLIDALRATDEPRKAAVDAAYTSARGMTGGRAADLDRAAFVQAVNGELDRGMWGRFVPDNVRGVLNDIAEGKTPFNVDAAVQIDGILSKVQRKAGEGSPEAAAIGVIRDSLNNTPFAQRAAVDAAESARARGAAAAADAARTVDEGVTDIYGRMQTQLPRPPGNALAPDFEFALPRQGTALGPATPPPVDEGAAARAAFEQARRAARSRFSTIEDTPALKAALDDVAPDKFVQRYVLGADVRDVQAMRRVLENSPEALAQARAQIADTLKRAAFGANASGDKAFSPERYLNTLSSIGRQKLEVFFTPAEMVRLNLAGKVASDIQSIPAGAQYAVNKSGTGAAVMNLLSKLTESPMMRQIPGARMISNQVGEIQTEQAINRALNPANEKVPVQLSPEALRRIGSLLPLGGAASGAFGGQTAPGGR
jgi:hypothetical protein